eukprot:jgi/Mesen1/8595/ME000005S08561
MQMYRTAAFVAYGSLNFSRQAYLKHAKAFKEEDLKQDLTGINCVVTGANAGIGKAAVEMLAARGATVHMLCRNKERGEAALADVRAKTKSEHVQLEVNNAGVMEHSIQKSPDGFEMNFAVNVLGVFALTELLMPALKRGAPNAKVICVATGGVLTEPLSTDLEGERLSKHDGTAMYARNKRVQLAITEKWGELHDSSAGGGHGVSFCSMHPGWVDTAILANSMPGFYKTFKKSLRTPEEGADSIAWLACIPNSRIKSGGFYFDRQEVSKHLPLAGTQHKAADVNEIYTKLRRMAGLEQAS